MEKTEKGERREMDSGKKKRRGLYRPGGKDLLTKRRGRSG